MLSYVLPLRSTGINRFLDTILSPVPICQRSEFLTEFNDTSDSPSVLDAHTGFSKSCVFGAVRIGALGGKVISLRENVCTLRTGPRQLPALIFNSPLLSFHQTLCPLSRLSLIPP